ncbi:MAG: porin family protein [Rhodobacteraceae bacterium]|nr:porin family protein [Paracoccaceae bacterium]
MTVRANIAALALAALPAVAALPVAAGSLAEPAPTPVIAPVIVEVAPLWAGGYVGAQAGYGWGSQGQSFDGNTWLGGLNAGFQGQTGAWVYGAEAEYDWAGDDINGLGLLKLRGGYATGNALVYAVAGGAYGDMDIRGKGYTDWGWLVGLGVDYMVTDNVFVGGEVDYMDWDEFDNSGKDIAETVATVRVGYKF